MMISHFTYKIYVVDYYLKIVFVSHECYLYFIFYGDMIQVVIPSHLVLKHKYTLIVGNTYIMQNFKVANNDFSFKATTHSFKLISYGATSAKVTNFPDIPLNHLKLISLTSIIAERFQPDFVVGNLII